MAAPRDCQNLSDRGRGLARAGVGGRPLKMELVRPVPRPVLFLPVPAQLLSFEHVAV